MKVVGKIADYPVKQDTKGRLWVVINGNSVALSRRAGWWGYYISQMSQIKIAGSRLKAQKLYEELPSPKHGRLVEPDKVYIYKTDKLGRVKKTFRKLGAIIDEY